MEKLDLEAIRRRIDKIDAAGCGVGRTDGGSAGSCGL